MSSSRYAYKDGIWISHMYRAKPLVDVIDKQWRKDKLFSDDIYLQPQIEKIAQQCINKKNPKERQGKLWQSTGLQRLNGDPKFV